MTSLAERVLEAIEAAEADAQDLHRDGCVSLHEQYPLDRLPCACGVPAAVLRRCAADRSILNSYEAVRESPSIHADAFAAMSAVVRDLAEAYGVPLEQEET